MNLDKWYEKHDLQPDESGWFNGVPECKKMPVTDEEWVNNVMLNSLRDVPNAKPCLYNPKTMVMVCGGATAKEYLDDIREKALSDDYDVFCSNKTGEWLLENGIIPQYHVCIDPKPEKANDFNVTHPDVKYLISLNCDQSVFEKLEGCNVEKFFAVSSTSDALLDGETLKSNVNGQILTICGGTMMGVRAITLAEALGYRKLEYYGFDGSIKSKDEQYAYDKKHNEAILEVEAEDGRLFTSTPLFADQVRQMMLWREMVPSVLVTFYGDSFMTHMMGLYNENKANKTKNKGTITPEYLEMQKQMHQVGNYGISGHKHAPSIQSLATQIKDKYGSVSVLDYGCGQSTLKKAIDAMGNVDGIEWHEYDPAIEGKDTKPTSADIVVCTDVMEHVEYDCIDSVLDDIQALTKKVAFFWISTKPAIKKLPNGENAHISVLPPDYWYAQINKRFVIAESQVYDGSVALVGQALEAMK